MKASLPLAALLLAVPVLVRADPADDASRRARFEAMERQELSDYDRRLATERERFLKKQKAETAALEKGRPSKRARAELAARQARAREKLARDQALARRGFLERERQERAEGADAR